ncbi:unnamed protein product [Chondrus crispus]|uniref:Uncharacterized protein n=1 Tax=Chondrus crispus TaxID=2769 RepID=R7QNT4_CHOCR|nr:unnamed protein product [Chondrus crispus]CDF39438.1 unnamed protein product [Chondrus crispus]|eukprot:XP_005719349.1 unnamed protein product [Chondrus crispus]
MPSGSCPLTSPRGYCYHSPRSVHPLVGATRLRPTWSRGIALDRPLWVGDPNSGRDYPSFFLGSFAVVVSCDGKLRPRVPCIRRHFLCRFYRLITSLRHTPPLFLHPPSQHVSE